MKYKLIEVSPEGMQPELQLISKRDSLETQEDF